MKTYEDFLIFLEQHLNHLSDFIPVNDRDFHAVCFALARFLLSEPYRWEQILETWPQLPKVSAPSKDELYDFFKSNKGLPLSFRKELKEDNREKLSKAYDLLYPIVISKDEFLSSIFREDFLARRYKKIFREGERKISRVLEKINRLKTNKEVVQLMHRFTKDLSGFSLTLINNKRLLDQTVRKLENIQPRASRR
jgi:hypothetical protein